MVDADDVVECLGCGVYCFIAAPENPRGGYCSVACRKHYEQKRKDAKPPAAQK